MMKKLCVVLLISIFLGCDTQSPVQPEKQTETELFRHLSMVEVGLGFPGSKERLEKCKKVNDEPCIQVYDSFVKAKSELLKLPKDQSLNLVLNTMTSVCAEDVSVNSKQVCTGTLVGIYYFTEPRHDKQIQQFFAELPPEIKSTIFSRSVSMNASWLQNRTDTSNWISWIETVDLDKTLKTTFVERLKNRDRYPSTPML